MSYITERVAYLKGLMEGLSIGEDTPEQKMLTKIVGVLEDMADVMDELDETLLEVDDQVTDLGEDLSLVQDLLFDEMEEDDEEDDFLEITCPNCGETVYFDQESMMGEDLVCPVCQTDILPTEENDEE